MMLKLEILNSNGEALASLDDEKVVNLVYRAEYNEGDTIKLTTDKKNTYLMLRLDDAMNEEFVYFTETEMVYNIPFGKGKISYSPKSFSGNVHVLSVREATDFEIKAYKNLARNCYDQHGEKGLYPHSVANVETRGEAVFASRNAINGNVCNESHGAWPYESWGINMQDDAEITLDFGRNVKINRMVLVTRADFPHDNYWKQVTFTFSDGSELVYNMEKSTKPHEVVLENEIVTSKIKLSKLIKDENDPSPFPALSQWEVYGTEA